MTTITESKFPALVRIDPPLSLCCPITHHLMDDPVVAADGYIYDRAAITQWINQQQDRDFTKSPMTQLRLQHERVESVLEKKLAIKEWCKENCIIHLNEWADIATGKSPIPSADRKYCDDLSVVCHPTTPSRTILDLAVQHDHITLMQWIHETFQPTVQQWQQVYVDNFSSNDRKAHLRTFQYLVDKAKVDPWYHTSTKDPVDYLVSYVGDLEEEVACLYYLLKCSSSTKIQSWKTDVGLSLLHLMVCSGHDLEPILKHKVDVNQPTTKGMRKTPLMMVQSQKMAQQLIDHGARVKDVDKDGHGVIYHAIVNEELHLVPYFIKKWTETVSGSIQQGGTCVAKEIMSGLHQSDPEDHNDAEWSKIIELFRPSSKDDVKDSSNSNNTTRPVFSLQESEQMVSYFTNGDEMPRSVAACLDVLHVSVNTTVHDGRSLLENAVHYGHESVVNLLLARKAQVNVPGKDILALAWSRYNDIVNDHSNISQTHRGVYCRIIQVLMACGAIFTCPLDPTNANVPREYNMTTLTTMMMMQYNELKRLSVAFHSTHHNDSDGDSDGDGDEKNTKRLKMNEEGDSCMAEAAAAASSSAQGQSTLKSASGGGGVKRSRDES